MIETDEILTLVISESVSRFASVSSRCVLVSSGFVHVPLETASKFMPIPLKTTSEFVHAPPKTVTPQTVPMLKDESTALPTPKSMQPTTVDPPLVLQLPHVSLASSKKEIFLVRELSKADPPLASQPPQTPYASQVSPKTELIESDNYLFSFDVKQSLIVVEGALHRVAPTVVVEPHMHIEITNIKVP